MQSSNGDGRKLASEEERKYLMYIFIKQVITQEFSANDRTL